ncbi:MAG: glycosyltransferase [Thermodesulfobacteriota bacterium]|nr:glycosyltransferase [Thermodesulfobacteriota bacterium]
MDVDVILPVFKGTRWVHETIESVLTQTYPKWHLTVIDDASPDDTVACIRPFCQSYPDRISLIQLAENRGAPGARMAAIGKTKGDVIAFIDQDDRWRTEKLETQIRRLNRKPRVQAVHSDVIHINQNGNIINRSADRENHIRSAGTGDILSAKKRMAKFILNNPVRLGTSVILREAFIDIGGFNETLFGGEDWEFWIRFASKWRIGHIAEPLVERRIHERNVSAFFKDSRINGAFSALDIIENRYPHLRPFIPLRRAQLLRRAAVESLENDRKVEAGKYARDLFPLKPMQASALLFLCLPFMTRHKPILRFVRRLRSSFFGGFLRR